MSDQERLQRTLKEQQDRWERNRVEADAKRDAEIARLAESLFGVRTSHSDGIATQYPVMAGVIRRALLDAYEAGQMAMGTQMLREMFDTTDRDLGLEEER